MRELLHSVRQSLGFRGVLAAGMGLAVLASLPPLWRSRFVTERRAGLRLKSAEAHLAARRFEEARSDLRAALRLAPADGVARAKLAAMEMGTGNWEIAFLEYESLTELHPEDPEGWTALAAILAKGGLLAAPEAALDKAIALAPKRPDARKLREEIRLRVGRHYGAGLDAEALGTRAAEAGAPPVPPGRVRAEAQAGSDPLAALAREHWPGRLARMRQALEQRMRQQDWDSAERVVESARAAYPGTAFPPFLAGILELARGNAEAAEGQLLRALALAPRSPVVATALAKAWSREKGAEFAAGRLMELAERDPGFAFARSMAARAFIDARDPVKAEAALRRGLVLQPDAALPYRQLAEHYLELDRAPDALAIATEGLQRFPDDLDLETLLARLSADLGKPEEAIRIYSGILTRRPDLDLVEYKLAAAVASEAGDEAVSRWSRQILQHLGGDAPSDPLLMDALGWLQFRAGAADRARGLLEAAVKAAPDEPGPHYHLALVHARENAPDLARRELKAAVESGRPFPGRLDALRLLNESVAPASPKPSSAAR